MPAAKNNSELTAAYLRSILEFDPGSGEFRWRERSDLPREWNSRWAGKVAGQLHKRGYRQIRIDGRLFLAHRLAWLYAYGAWPNALIDHRFGACAGDALRNLREATPSQNQANRPRQSNNKSGVKGVFFDRRVGMYSASIRASKRTSFLGLFSERQHAAAAYRIAAAGLQGEFAYDKSRKA